MVICRSLASISLLSHVLNEIASPLALTKMAVPMVVLLVLLLSLLFHTSVLVPAVILLPMVVVDSTIMFKG